MTFIKAAEFVEKMNRKEDMIILDVRTDVEWNAEHLKGTVVHMPLHTLNQAAAERLKKTARGKPVYILCRSGGRATKAYEFLSAQGIDNLHIIQGGIEDCKSCNAETMCGKTMSLERQVRIVAGLLIIAGFVAGWMGFTAGHFLSALIGAGLVFAGITDRCGMALILARAPWNRKNVTNPQDSIQCFIERTTNN